MTAFSVSLRQARMADLVDTAEAVGAVLDRPRQLHGIQRPIQQPVGQPGHAIEGDAQRDENGNQPKHSAHAGNGDRQQKRQGQEHQGQQQPLLADHRQQLADGDGLARDGAGQLAQRLAQRGGAVAKFNSGGIVVHLHFDYQGAPLTRATHRIHAPGYKQSVRRASRVLYQPHPPHAMRDDAGSPSIQIKSGIRNPQITQIAQILKSRFYL